MEIFRWTQQHPFQGLALTGGGYRGLFTARILENFEHAFRQPIGRCFDLVSGTSIGGIIALSIAFEVPMTEVVKVFWAQGKYIFPQKKLPFGLGWTHKPVHLFFPRYCSQPLRKAITSLIPENTLLGEAKHPVVIPAMNVSKGLLEAFKTRHLANWTRDSQYRVVDVALATSAAPTYFELAKLNDSYYADGGLFANAPDQILVHEAQHFLKVPDAALRLLSIGTTTASYAIPKKEGRNFGIWKWMNNGRLFSTIISAQQQFVNQIMQHRYPGYLRIDYNQPANNEFELGLDAAAPHIREMLIELADKVALAALAGGALQPFFSTKPKLKII